MNLSELREAVGQRQSWRVSASDTDGIATLNTCINRAYQQLSSLCPGSIRPERIRYIIQGAVRGGQDTAIETRLVTTSDPYVMRFFGGSFALPTPDSTVWDGAMVLSFRDPVDQLKWYIFQPRMFWETVGGEIYCTLDRPYTGDDPNTLNWSLVPRSIWLPADVQRIEDGRAIGVFSYGLSFTTRQKMMQMGAMWDPASNVAVSWGPPQTIGQIEKVQMTAPLRKPTVSSILGPFTGPAGKFQYCYTLCQGYQDADNRSPGGSKLVLRESSPSPASDEIAITAADAIQLDFPDFEYEQGFRPDPATLRSGKSGVFLRIYRRRLSTTVGTSGPAILEDSNVWQFWQDLDGTTTTTVDSGLTNPDWSLRLQPSAGCARWDLYPVPMKRTEFQLDCTRRPLPLVDDSDAPRIQDDAVEALVALAASYLAQVDKQPDMAVYHKQEAMGMIKQLSALYANSIPSISRRPWDWGDAPYPIVAPIFRSS